VAIPIRPVHFRSRIVPEVAAAPQADGLFPPGNTGRRNLVTNQRYIVCRGTKGMQTMADRTGLRIIGFIAASITGAVMLIAAVMVHKTMAGAFPLEVPYATIAPR